MRGSLVAVLAALLAAPHVVAQNIKVVADIPFQFLAGGEARSAGTWTITRISLAVPLFQITGDDNRKAMLVLGHPAYRSWSGPREAKLVFNRYGDRYYLSEVWDHGEIGAYFVPCKEERALRLAGMKADRTVTYARMR